jgi:hypothetical protein
MTSGVNIYEKSALGKLTRIAGSSQATIFRTAKAVLSGVPLAYKQYSEKHRTTVSFGVLTRLTGILFELPADLADDLLTRAAWPVALVRDGGSFSGFLMPEARSEFWGKVQHANNELTDVTARLEYLLNPEGSAAYGLLDLSNDDRIVLLGHVADSMALMHRFGLTIPDLSPRNILFSASPNPKSFIVDCDSFSLNGSCATPIMTTVGWDAPGTTSEDLATTSADSYKYGLLVLRILNRDQSLARYESDYARRVPSQLAGLLNRALGPIESARPAMAEWSVTLKAC